MQDFYVLIDMKIDFTHPFRLVNLLPAIVFPFQSLKELLLARMSSVVILLPKGHRTKVSTTPNMSLLAIKVGNTKHELLILISIY